jgi:hypothetical protein
MTNRRRQIALAATHKFAAGVNARPLLPTAVAYLCRWTMPRWVEGVFNPEGWQRVAGGRSRAQTPGRESVGSVHPEGMPEFCDPSRVGWRFLIIGPGLSLPPSLGYSLASLQLAQTS